MSHYARWDKHITSRGQTKTRRNWKTMLKYVTVKVMNRTTDMQNTFSTNILLVLDDYVRKQNNHKIKGHACSEHINTNPMYDHL